MYIYFNPNPAKKLVGDCVIRGICKLIGDDWETTYTHVIVQGYKMFDMPSSNAVWGAYLKSNGYSREIIPLDNECQSCYTIKDFCGVTKELGDMMARSSSDIERQIIAKLMDKFS